MTEWQEEMLDINLPFEEMTQRGLVNHWDCELVMVGSEAQPPKAVLLPLPEGLSQHSSPLQPCSVPFPAKPFFTQ